MSRLPTTSWSWVVRVGALVCLGVAVRVVYLLVVLRHVPPGLDSVWYSLQGGSIRQGTGYVVPGSLFRPPHRPTAGFPPLYPGYQALWQSAFGDGGLAVRLAGVVPAAVTIVSTACIGRMLLGRRSGLIAAAIVAVDPVLVAVDGSAMSENLSVPLMTVVVLLLVSIGRFGVRWPTVVALGWVCGLAALTRQDLVLLVPVAVVAVVLGARAEAVPWRRALVFGAVAGAVALAVIGPWSVRNHRQLGTWSTSTLSATSALAGANCDRTYGGRSIGSWEFSCVEAAKAPGLDEAGQAARYQRVALRYAADHRGRLPLVVVAREARAWGFWDPSDQLPREVEESRRYGWQAVAWPWRIALVLAGTVGLAGLVRRVPRGWPVLLPIAVTMLSVGLGHGNPRFSAIAHPVLAVGVAALVAHRRRSA